MSAVHLRAAPSAHLRSVHDEQATAPDTIDDVLARARQRIVRWSPHEALHRRHQGALIVDIRPYHQRVDEGEIPGSFVIERNVLEWRLDPRSASRIPQARDHHSEFVIVCSEGYTSSLAAASLVDLGLAGSGDVIGGVRSWIASGLPYRAGGTPAGQRVPGSLGPPPRRR